MPPSQKINLKDKIDDGEIDLSMCDLQDVPVKDIANTKNIYSLDLSNNHLITLPKNFATLKFLTKLDLSKNSLKELPENFGDLTKLKHLDLYKNQLQHLPLSFSKLKSLKWLDLKDNPLVPVIREAAGLCLDSKQCLFCAKNIVQFYTEFQEKLETEREERDKQKQRDLQAQLAQKQKQQEKKNRKREKKIKDLENAKNNHEVEDTIIQEESDVSTDNFEESNKTTIYGAIFNALKSLLLRVMITLVFIFVMSALEFDLGKRIHKTVTEEWYKFIQRVPMPYQSYAEDFGFYFSIVHVKTKQTIYFISNYYIYIINQVNKDNINYIYEKIMNFYYDLFKIK